MQLCLALAGILSMTSCAEQKNSMRPSEPIAEKKDSAITFHNHTRIDQYFWMRLTDEQKNAATPDQHTKKVLDYLTQENDYTAKVMKNTEALQKELFDEIVGRIKKDDASVPYLDNGYWYYSRYEDGKEYPIHCRKKGSLENKEEILIDVNAKAEGKSYYSATALSVSPDNKTMAFFEDVLSRRIYTLRFINLETGELLKDEITNVQAGGVWSKDNSTFFYVTKNKTTLLSEKIWRHTMGKESTDDKLVYHEKDVTNYIDISKTKSGEYIVINSANPISSEAWILKADQPTANFKQFSPRRPNVEYFIDHHQDKFFITTNDDAENFRLMETPVNSTQAENWKELIPNRQDVMLEGVDIFKNHMVISEKTKALNQIRIINLRNGKDNYLEFPEDVYLAATTANPEYDTNILRFSYSSMSTPNSTIDYNMDTQEKNTLKVSEVVGGHNPADYEVKRLWATSRDSIQIPISIIYKKGTKLDGKAPLLQYAYGSYGTSTNAAFSSTRLSLLDRGFIYAIAHIRGGQEMGRRWYLDGKMFNKINTFNDFIDCSKYLIDNKYTSPEHLYAMGGSAGGLLMGAVLNMEPKLYNGIIAAVPFVDVINTMLDETIPLTTNEFDEWGNPKNKDSYDYMLRYSPYDNIEAKEYPNILVTTGLFDSQVQYWEPAKWVAKLRDQKTDDNILMLHTNMKAGHGGSSGRFEAYKEVALEYAFMLMLEKK